MASIDDEKTFDSIGHQERWAYHFEDEMHGARLRARPVIVDEPAEPLAEEDDEPRR
jgi:hypothetical protein